MKIYTESEIYKSRIYKYENIYKIEYIYCEIDIVIEVYI